MKRKRRKWPRTLVRPYKRTLADVDTRVDVLETLLQMHKEEAPHPVNLNMRLEAIERRLTIVEREASDAKNDLRRDARGHAMSRSDILREIADELEA